MRNMKIGRRVALAFGAVLVILALSVAAGIWRLKELAATTRQLAMVRRPPSLFRRRRANWWSPWRSSGWCRPGRP